ncbi:MAG: glycosyltransferase family 2 protein [Sideroxyarcus sp.]|nr:glycosyltransferase family 2 protein [Sideroxyarcus sp.]
MRFTVVIPCYNSSESIGVALDSLVKQSFTDFEVVLIDDASIDYARTLSVIDGYRDKLSICVLSNSTNMNGAYSRNRGIEIANGEFIAFLDSDDSWVPDRLESASELIEKLPSKRFLMYGQFELIRGYSTGALLPLRGIREAELVTEYVFAACQQMQTSTFVCSAYLAREVMFDNALNRHQDSDFAMRAQHVGAHIVFQPCKCASYFFRAGDFRRRVTSGRINREFCNNWLDSKKSYFSPTAIAGYKLSVFSRILYVEGDITKSLCTFVLSLGGVGLRNFVDLVMTKFYIVYKSRFGL